MTAVQQNPADQPSTVIQCTQAEKDLNHAGQTVFRSTGKKKNLLKYKYVDHLIIQGAVDLARLKHYV